MRTAVSLGLVLALLLVLPLELWATIELRRPTTQANPNTGGDVAFSSPANGRDTDEMTFARGPASATVLCSGSPLSLSETTSIRYHTWQTTAETYSELTLKVKSAVSIETFTEGSATASGTATLEYTLNGGTGWNTIYSVTSDRGSTTDIITLSSAQDLTQVQIRYRGTVSVSCVGTDQADASVTFDSYDNRTEGVFGEGQKLIIARRAK